MLVFGIDAGGRAYCRAEDEIVLLRIGPGARKRSAGEDFANYKRREDGLRRKSSPRSSFAIVTDGREANRCCLDGSEQYSVEGYPTSGVP